VTAIRSLFFDDRGQGLVEYGLIISLIAIVAIIGLTALRTNADIKLRTAANAVT
jgi:Flp pilus assembly pilin Flp